MLKRARLLLYAACLLCGVSVPAAAQIILSAEHDSVNVRRFTQTLAQALPELDIQYVARTQLTTQTQFSADTQLILLGPALLDWRLQLSGRPPATLILQVSRVQAYQRLAGQQPSQITFLWSDPPLERQVALLKVMLPGLKNVGVLYGKHSAFLLPEMEHILQTENLTLHKYYWSNSHDARSLNHLLEKTEVLLGIDDTTIYNPTTIKSILLSSYARKQTLIGPTAAFIKAGSLASTYSDQNDWIHTLSRLLQMPSTTWPSSQYPSDFKVMSNRQVARSLGIQKTRASLINTQLQQRRQTP
ncbi:MAG: ABC transporter substrate binding protein [Pseudomonas sp.]|jgi:hypothetical protein|nr:ABC transporter substrate binding protein [Pseudomonas sp.]